MPLYASAYAGFAARDQVRRHTYGDDHAQSGWLTSDELNRFAEWLELGAGARLLDVGCGSGGPALRLAEATGARAWSASMCSRKGSLRRPGWQASAG